MGQKINPVGFRVGITKNWSSKWFADKGEYAKLALEDRKIRNYLEKKFDLAGLKSVDIERSTNMIHVIVKVSKPGVVIGKGGSGIEQVQEELKELTDSKLSLTAEEVKTPELEAQLVANYICRQLKRRVPYRRVATHAAQAAMDKGAKGIKIKLSGLLSGGNSIARSERTVLGSVPTQTLRADIDYAQVDCHLLYGAVGIKVWIHKGEVKE